MNRVAELIKKTREETFVERMPDGKLVNMTPAEKAAVTVWVKDGLAMSNQPVTIEAELLSQGLLSQQGMGGEPLELVVRGEVMARAMTGGDGRARLSYIPKGLGVVPVQVLKARVKLAGSR